MATPHNDIKLQSLTDATKKLESDENLAFDDVVKICFQELKRWQDGGTDGSRTEIAGFLWEAGRKARRLQGT